MLCLLSLRRTHNRPDLVDYNAAIVNTHLRDDHFQALYTRKSGHSRCPITAAERIS